MNFFSLAKVPRNKWKVRMLFQTKHQSKNPSLQSKLNLENYSECAHQSSPSMIRPQSVTSLFAELISNAKLSDLSEVVQTRSKRMLLDTLGVGILGFNSETTRSVMSWAENLGYFEEHKRGTQNTKNVVIWGSSNKRAPIGLATYLNGISIHSMDFDDTWHPATHPSGPVLPAVLSLSDYMTGSYCPTSEELLVAYNVGIQTQGLLLHSSAKSKNIPERFHPPAVVGVMGAAAATARLLQLGPLKTKHALAIAASFAGAPMANAGTQCKPLHTGKSARFGLEAALMADQGMEGNENILDSASGFSVFFEDYSPDLLLEVALNNQHYILHNQDAALKRFPAHLAMHWAIDATMEARQQMTEEFNTEIPYNEIKEVQIVVPSSKYIDRPFPKSQHEARHSFQFNVASMLLDGIMTPESFTSECRSRTNLNTLLQKCHLLRKKDNIANFNRMYVEVMVTLKNNKVYRGRCDTPYGHWRKPLTDIDVKCKFLNNTKSLPNGISEAIIESVMSLSGSTKELLTLLKN
ncbi:cis-aconitate decarboxylase isoform X1 [Octopus bimaculoides]|uniref:Cis-aconitate decarboxylase n=2 Tax=Octopus bimaculoides TaxID=37653 RepID=A0A0L8GPU9_OCTBM|nr:cis-aconitate decarboxylase isoform X1 [Octopus bimaculoides]|eukprot:XP_014779084.1 PREDICTED: cis-aconitate decarboxylase-like [Octopus bimaculoides]